MPAASDALSSMLAAHPDAWVGAVGPDALYVPIPTSVPVDGHRRLQGRWALDHVAPADRGAMGAAWRGLGETGVATVRVQLVTGGAATFHVFKVSEVCGVDIVMAITEDDADLGVPAIVQDTATASRFCRVLRDESGRAIEIDLAAPDVIGWSAEELLSRTPPLERVHPDDRGQLIENWMATLSDATTGHRSRARLLRCDGSYTWFEITNFNRLDDPYRPCVTSEFLDISEEMAAHEAVRAREQLLHRLAEALPLGVLQLDPERRIVYKNDYLGVIIGEDHATTMDEQFAGAVDEDRPFLDKAFDAALVDGSDDDVIIRITPGGARSEQLIRVITKSLRADNGEATGVIACISDVTETELMGRELERRATFDALTGCLNRAAILARLDGALVPGEGGTAAIFLDLDDFKAVNDRCGHLVGDEMLKAAARLLDATIREGDFIGRLGGDEFLVVCHDVTASDAMELAQRISGELRRHPMVLGSHVPLKASIGVAWGLRGTVASEDLVERSDAAMYRSKRGAAGEPHLWGQDRGSAISA